MPSRKTSLSQCATRVKGSKMQAGRCFYQPPVFLRGFLELTFPEIRGVAAVVVKSVLGS